jgi:flagellar hook-basal body complex protein FliE
MKIGEISSILPANLIDKAEKPNNTDFKNVLTDFIGNVNQDQLDSMKSANDFITGNNNVELQDVMISAEKAKTSLELLMEIRNKAIDMYKELTNIQF